MCCFEPENLGRNKTLSYSLCCLMVLQTEPDNGLGRTLHGIGRVVQINQTQKTSEMGRTVVGHTDGPPVGSLGESPGTF